MNRLDFISNIAQDSHLWARKGFLNAFAAALGGKEVCRILATCTWPTLEIRDCLLKNVLEDFRNGNAGRSHSSISSRLIRSFHKIPRERRQSATYLLKELFPHSSARSQDAIVSFLLDSHLPSFRRRAYTLVQEAKRPSLISPLERRWLELHEPEAFDVIILHSPDSFLEDNLHELLKLCDDAWRFRRLLFRVGRAHMELLAELRSEDEITYVYLLARFGEVLSDTEAIEVLERHIEDERINILIWSFGKMGLWRALEYSLGKAAKLEKINRARGVRRLEKLVGGIVENYPRG